MDIPHGESKVDINGLRLIRLLVVPKRKVVITVFGARNIEEPVREHEIQVSQIRDVEISFQKFGDNVVRSYDVSLSKSSGDFQNSSADFRQSEKEASAHLNVIFDEGVLKVTGKSIIHVVVSEFK